MGNRNDAGLNGIELVSKIYNHIKKMNLELDPNEEIRMSMTDFITPNATKTRIPGKTHMEFDT